MFGTYFYNETIKRCVSVFGTLFNNVDVKKIKSDGTVLSQFRVPISYGPKQKFLDRLAEEPNLSDRNISAIKLPRMSFEITGIAYDTARQLSKINNVVTAGTANTNRNKLFTGVPYIISFQLNVYAKTQDDSLQIVEQILPSFNPQYSLTLIPFASEYPNYREDLPIAINGVSFQDDFENELGARRTIIYTLDFEMRVSFYSGINQGEVIRQANARLFDIGRGIADSDVRVQTLQIDPNPITSIGLADSDFGFTTTYYGANDSDGF